MRKSKRLRLRDLRDIYQLIGECRDLGDDVEAWYGRLLTGAGELVGAHVTTGGHLEGLSAGEPRVLLALDYGWADPKFHDLMEQWLATEDFQADLLYYRICQQRRPLLTRYRRQIIGDQEWYRDEFFHEYRKVAQVDDCLCSIAHFPGRDLFQDIILHRAPGDRGFGEWERRVIHWLHHELAPLVGRQLASAQDPPFCLPPRLRQTLECLLQGDSEKQIANRLGLSRQTVHDYVKALYRRFGVNSRGELLARWIGKQNGNANVR